MGKWQILRPAAGVNLIERPSFEPDDWTFLDKWTAGGLHDLAITTDQARFGAHSMECTYQSGSNYLATWVTNTVQLSANTQYCLSAYVYLNSDWDGGDVSVVAESYTSATQDDTTNAATSTTGSWVRIWTVFTTAADGNGNLRIKAGAVATAGRIFYVDGVVCEEGSAPTTYIDGDQDDCYWIGTRQDSVSVRKALGTRGGTWVDFGDDLSFKIERMAGVGVAKVANRITQYASRTGGYFSGLRYPSRAFALIGSFLGSSLANLHALRQALYNVLNADTEGANTLPGPRRLRYQGATDAKVIDAYYDGGLEFSGPTGFSEKAVALTFAAPDPAFKGELPLYASLDSQDSGAYDTVAGRVNGVWSALNTSTMSATYTYVIEPLSRSKVYVGGSFTNAGGVANADYIGVYDSYNDTWAAVGNPNSGAGVSMSQVTDIKRGPDGTLYMCGVFQNVEGVAAADYIAKFDGSNWTAVGTPNTGAASISQIYAMAFNSTGALYVVGSFSNLGDVAAADGIAVWDGSSWAAVGTPNTGAASITYIRDIVIDEQDNVYVAGAFTNLGDVAAADYVAYWDGSAWNALGSGMDTNAYGLALDNAGNLYCVGVFSTAGGVSALGAAKWNGAAWSALGGGVASNGYQCAYSETTGELAVAGVFSTVEGGEITTTGIAFWNGSAWRPNDFNYYYSGGWAVAYLEDDLYIGTDTSGTAYWAGSTNITYTGTAPAYPVIHIRRDGGTLCWFYSIRNVTTGAELWFRPYRLLDGEELTIDLRPGKRSATSNFHGNIWGKILSSSDVSSFYLAPGNAAAGKVNTITAYQYNTGSPTVTVYLEYHNAYNGLD